MPVNNPMRAAVMVEGGKGSLNGSAGIKDVIYEDDVFAVYEEVHIRRAGLKRLVSGAEVVAIEGDVKAAGMSRPQGLCRLIFGAGAHKATPRGCTPTKQTSEKLSKCSINCLHNRSSVRANRPCSHITLDPYPLGPKIHISIYGQIQELE